MLRLEHPKLGPRVSLHPGVVGAARLANARQRALPRSAHEWLERLPEEGRHLAVLDALRAPLALAPDTLESEMATLEREWFAPLLAMLKRRRLARLTVHTDTRCFTITRAGAWRVWRRARPLPSS